MCNIWTSEHTFIWTSSSSTDARIPDKLVCQCGAFHRDGTMTFQEAQRIALNSLYVAEARRQKERETEAAYWQDVVQC